MALQYQKIRILTAIFSFYHYIQTHSQIIIQLKMKLSLVLLLPVAFAMPRWCRNTGCHTAAIRSRSGVKLHRGQAQKAIKPKKERQYHEAGFWTHRKYFLEQRAVATAYDQQVTDKVDAYFKFLDGN